MTLAVALAACASAPSAAPEPPAAAIVGAAPDAAASDAAAQQKAFSDWVARLRATARAAGIGEATLGSAFDAVQYLPRVVELDCDTGNGGN